MDVLFIREAVFAELCLLHLALFCSSVSQVPNKPRISWKAVPYHEIELRKKNLTTQMANWKKYNICCTNINNNHSVSIRTKRRFVLVTHLKPATLYKCTLQASNHPQAQQNPKECITSVDVEHIQTPNLSASRYYSFIT